MSHNRLITCLALLSLLAASCAGTPRQIASYPKEEPVTLSTYPNLPETYTYDAYLELESHYPDSSASRAIKLTEEYGGYLVDSRSWWVDEEEHINLVLRVPAANFDKLYGELLLLGDEISEHIYGTWDGRGDGWSIYSQISLQIHPKQSVLEGISLGRWRPVDTLQKAWSVSTSIFGFLLDALIWLVVVVGPFVLIGLGIRKLVLKVRH
jgi:hypothetical protein